jgi:general secretion pathway protein K
MKARMKAITGMQGQRGIALVLVLWATTLLTVIAASFVFSIRTDTLLAQNLVSAARAQALADAGMQRALFELFKPQTDKQRWSGDGVSHQWEFGGAKISVMIQDVSGKIDLNTASDALLKGLLKSAGLDDEHSSALLDAILDWRDPDDLRRLNGAEAADYQAAGLKYKPSNAPFETVDELKRVLGMTPQIYLKLANSLTVDSRQAGLNPVIASKNALLALPNVDEAMVDAYLALRQEAVSANLPPPPFPPAAAFVASINGSVYSVRAKAVLPDGAVFIRETVVRINQGAVRKVAFLSWKDGETTPKASGENPL